MPGQNARQAYRQRAGFLAENLLQRSFEEAGILAISFARSHVDEAGRAVAADWKRDLSRLTRLSSRVRGVVGQRIRLARSGRIGEYRLSRNEAVARTLLGSCDLIRWDQGTPIISEVKSQLGPTVDFRVEFQATQVIALGDFAAAGLAVTVLYYVALPNPEYIEIPWAALPHPPSPLRPSDVGRGYRFRTRVPASYRDRTRYVRIPNRLVPYRGEADFLRCLIDDFKPGSRPGLQQI